MQLLLTEICVNRICGTAALALAYLASAAGAAGPNGGEAAKKNTKEVVARVVDVDAPTKTLVVMVRGGGREVFTVPDDAKVIDADGRAIARVLNDKGLKPGTEVKLSVGPDGRTCREVRLSAKVVRESRVQQLRRRERELQQMPSAAPKPAR
jgi:hypothetical protein